MLVQEPRCLRKVELYLYKQEYRVDMKYSLLSLEFWDLQFAEDMLQQEAIEVLQMKLVLFMMEANRYIATLEIVCLLVYRL